MDLRPITDYYAVAPQITAEDVAAIAAAGYKSVMCNRPDGEEFDQPDFDEIEAAAQAAGLVTRWVPVISGRMGRDDLAQFFAALEELPQPLLAYCRTGTRCTMLWTIAQHGRMTDEEILNVTSAAGYDMAGLVAQLSQSR